MSLSPYNDHNSLKYTSGQIPNSVEAGNENLVSNLFEGCEVGPLDVARPYVESRSGRGSKK